MWALGCTFYEVVHIKPMFAGPFLTLINKIASVQLLPFEADCPEDFEKAIMQCFEANPDSRPDPLSFIEMVEKVKFEMQQTSTSRYFSY